VPGRLEAAQRQDPQQVADVKASGRRIDAEIQGHRRIAEQSREFAFVGVIVEQIPSPQVGKHGSPGHGRQG